MSLVKLRLSMLGTLAFIIALSTLFFTVVLSLIGTFNILATTFFVLVFNLAQWLFAPYIIDALYRAREVAKSEEPRLHETVERLSQKSGIKKPRVMIANIPLPNAFAYGSPIAGTRVAVTTGLLDKLEYEEVEAVLGHELGHLKHRDVQVMMFVSVLPALFYYLGYSFLLSSSYGRREERGSGAALIGLASIAIYWILTLFVLQLSRLREYYADRHSVTVVEDGARKLSEALAKIVNSTGRLRRYQPQATGSSSFKTLFIADPDSAVRDAVEISQARASDQQLVRDLLTRELTSVDRLIEIFSTHPNIVKRLQALQAL